MIAVTGLPSERPARSSRGRAFWAWLSDVLLPKKPERKPPLVQTEIAAAERADIVPLRQARAAAATREPEQARVAATVLPFPVRHEAPLVKLADVLSTRVGDRGPDNDPLLLTLLRRPHPRLLIDRAAYVDYDLERGSYRAVVEVLPDTTLVLATGRFDTLVDFVLQYAGARAGGPLACEEAS